MQRDEQIFELIKAEKERQINGIELIASENFTSDQVMEATGSVLTNKYAEGYPGKRYYGGCEFVDVVETLALERVKKLFGADQHGWAANVQANSGSQANQAVYFALLKPGDTILGLDLAHGGHVTLEGAETLRAVYPALYAEAQRRYLESVSPYARRLFHQMAAPYSET